MQLINADVRPIPEAGFTILHRSQSIGKIHGWYRLERPACVPHAYNTLLRLRFVASNCNSIRQDLFKLAEDMGMTDKMRSIALGQGQGSIAAAMIEKVWKTLFLYTNKHTTQSG